SLTGGSLKVNKAAGAAKLDWSTFAPAGATWAPFAVPDTLDLHVGGAVTLNAFGSLIATGTLDLNEGQVSDATVGSSANALSFKITSGLLVAGGGGTLGGTTIATDKARVFCGSVTTLTVESIAAPETSWAVV